MKIERVQPVSRIDKKLPKKTKEEPKKEKKDTFEKSPELEELLRRAME